MWFNRGDSKKYLIVGLGNPGKKYADTRHNIGFQVLDAFAEKNGILFQPGRHADIARYRYKGRIFVLIKPTTFMNLSGKAVNYWLRKEKLSIENLLIITDDIALPFGTLRLRAKGGAGGHNGLEHINETLGRTDYPRLRFGIGGDFHKGQQVDYVLDEWSEGERKIMHERILLATEVIKNFGTAGIERTMSEYNNS